MKLTQDQIDSFNEYQESGIFHPFTCGNRKFSDVLIATENGLRCKTCEYTQNWVHSWMIDWSWKKLDPLKRYI